MFTGIVQGVATVARITDRPGLRSFTLRFPPGFAHELAIGASVSCDGVCLTVTTLHGDDAADFDVMAQSLRLTSLGALVEGSPVNVERAARDGAEIGGHPLSGHVDFTATVAEVRQPENNHVLRIQVPAPWMRYVFAKGYIAVNGASLTVAEADRADCSRDSRRRVSSPSESGRHRSIMAALISAAADPDYPAEIALVVSRANKRGEPVKVPKARIGPDDLAAITPDTHAKYLLTSGSTGTPARVSFMT